MKDIYSPLEIDEEWDNYAPVAEGSSTALMERPTNESTSIPVSSSDVQASPTTETGAEAFAMPASNVMPGKVSPDAAYTAAEALIDNPATNTDTFDIADTSSSNASDTSGLVKITPGETTPEIPSTDTPHKIEPVKIDVMGGETPDSIDTLSDPIDESTGDNKIVSVPEATPLIAPMVKEEDSDDVINTGTISPYTIEASDDSGESSSGDDTENTKADTSAGSSDATGKSSETKADKPEAPSSTGDDELADIMDKWHKSNKEIANMLEEARKESEANVSRMRSEKTSLKAKLEQQISDLDEGIANEQARLAKIQTNLAKLSSDKDN